jgi:hypothetical protein
VDEQMVGYVNGWTFRRVGEWMNMRVGERVRRQINAHEDACIEGWVCGPLMSRFDWWLRSMKKLMALWMGE